MFQNKKVIDAHCHIYPEKIASKAVEGIGSFYDIPMGEKGTAADLLAKGNAAGIDSFLIFSVATKPSQVSSINRFIASQAALSEGRMVGLGTIHPESENLAGDIEQVAALGLKGVKIHPDFQAFKLDDYRYMKAYDICGALGLPVLVHTGDRRYDYSNPNRMAPVLECFPNTVFIGAHFGGWSMWEEAAERLSGYENFYVDCSSSFYALEKSRAVDIIRRYGADRVLFGTDYPMWNAGEELAYFSSLSLTEEEQKQILHENAQKIFKI